MIDVDRLNLQGWFPFIDQLVFDLFLTWQAKSAHPSGDLLEIGVFQGKTAIFMGGYLRAGETLIACDLFGMTPRDEANQAEVRDYLHYGSSVTAEDFADRYRSFHGTAPRVLAMDSTAVGNAVTAGSVRFSHVDGSHIYRQVRRDIAAVQRILATGGVVAIDDYRARRSAGVGAAVWEAVATQGLHPIALTEQKFYGTWGEPGHLSEALRAWCANENQVGYESCEIAGAEVIQVWHIDGALRLMRETAAKRWPMRGDMRDISCR